MDKKIDIITKVAERFKSAGPFKVFILLAITIGTLFTIICTMVECKKKCGRTLFDKTRKERKKRSGR